MARLFVVLALLGAAYATPTPQTLPKVVLGLYENVPGKDNNFAEFAKVLRLPENVEFGKRNLIGIRKDGDTYHQVFWFYPATFNIDLPFKLGETQTTVINGKNVEYVYTVEGTDTTETTLRGKFREVDGDTKFTVEATFNELGYNATYTRDNVIAKRTYRRTLPWYVLGAFEMDATRVPENYQEFSNNIYPLPKGLSWTKDTKFWIGRQGDTYYDKVIIDPTYYKKIPFQLNTKASFNTPRNETIEYKYSVEETTPKTTTVKATFTTAKMGTVVFTSVFDVEGVTCTAKAGTTEITSYYKRVLPWMFYGIFEDVPEKTENWEELVKGDDETAKHTATRIQYYRKGDQYVLRKTMSDKTTVAYPFKLNTPAETTIPTGKVVKSNVTVEGRGDKIVLVSRMEFVGTDKKFTAEVIAAPEGIYATYKRGNVVAKKFYRRVVSKTVYGTFESTTDNEDFKTFANTIGAPELLKKTTIEFGETPDHKITQKLTPEGGETQETTFTLGTPAEFTAVGKQIKYLYYYFEADNTPILRGVFNQTANPTNNFEVAGVFRPDGYTATYTYNQGAQIAKREYTRKGPQVPIEPTPTN